MRIQSLGGWLVGIGVAILAGCGGGSDSLPTTPHAVLQHHAYDPQVAFDAAGNGAAVWSQFDGLLLKLVMAPTCTYTLPVKFNKPWLPFVASTVMAILSLSLGNFGDQVNNWAFKARPIIMARPSSSNRFIKQYSLAKLIL